MSFISLRDIPHEFIITIGAGVKLERTMWERVKNIFTPVSTDLELFFDFDIDKWRELDEAGLTLEHYRHFPDIKTTWEDIAVALGQMPSKGQARKNGWSGQVPDGYSEMKRKFHRFYILKLGEELNDG